MEVWNPEHPHHAVWREYTQSLLDGKPKRITVRVGPNHPWVNTTPPSWNVEYEYRIARPMLTLTYSVPMPVTEELDINQKYWMASQEFFKPMWTIWSNNQVDHRRLHAGLIYLTEADAQAAIDARNAAMMAAMEGAK